MYDVMTEVIRTGSSATLLTYSPLHRDTFGIERELSPNPHATNTQSNAPFRFDAHLPPRGRDRESHRQRTRRV